MTPAYVKRLTFDLNFIDQSPAPKKCCCILKDKLFVRWLPL